MWHKCNVTEGSCLRGFRVEWMCVCCDEGWCNLSEWKLRQKTKGEETEEKRKRIQWNRGDIWNRKPFSNGATDPGLQCPPPRGVVRCQIFSKLPAVQGFGGCLGIIQGDIQSDIHQGPLWEPLWADEIGVVSVETGSSALAVARDPSRGRETTAHVLSGQSHWVPGSVPQGQWFSLHFSFVTPALCLSSRKVV